MTIEIKICGLTNADDARAAVNAGADYLGFVLYDGSPRGITAPDLRKILDELVKPVRAVGVFVNASADRIGEIITLCGLHAVQIHGDEVAEDYAGISVPVWRCLRCGPDGISPDPSKWAAARYVVDAARTASQQEYGGSGRTADWTLARELADVYPVMLAGGLTPGNVSEAVRAVRPKGVDTSSGVEAEVGKKDHRKIVDFIQRARTGANNEA